MAYTDRDPSEEDQLARLLAEFEGRLGLDEPSTVPIENPSTASASHYQRLADAQACVLLLDEIWPHGPQRDPDAFAQEELPTTVGPFRVLRELGRGGFGIVYLAEDDRLGRQVAVKVQRPEAIVSAELRARFLREAKAAARLHHPNIANVFEIGETGVQIWIASEYIGGGSLAAWLAAHHGPVAARTAATLVRTLADAVECAHRQGVWHRDLKPGNVLLEPQDSAASPADLANYQPKLIDFSLAKLFEANHHETRTGALIGTPSNMAPEQAMGHVRQIGPATDVYGLGTILYELLAGQRPFRGANDIQTLRRVVEDEPLDPRRLVPAVPADLAAICLKCLEKSPERRYASATHLAEDLRRFMAGEPTAARPLSPAERVSKWMSRRPLVAALVCLACVSVSAIVALSVDHSWRLAGALSISEQERQAAIVARAEAEELRNDAMRERDANELYLYAARMRQAADAREQGDVGTTAKLLAQYEVGTRLAHLRGYEWHYLQATLHNERSMLHGHEGEVYGVVFSPDGRLLVSGGEDGTIRLWDSATGQLLRTIDAHGNCTNDLAFSPDGQLLASASCDHTVKLWNTSTWQCSARIDGYEDVLSVNFSPDGQFLASGDAIGAVNIWKVPSGELVSNVASSTQRRHGVNALEWSEDGQWLAFPCGVTDSVSIWDTRTRTVAKRLPARSPIALAFSPDGERVAFNSLSAIEVHDTKSGKLVAVHDARADKVQKLVFTPDGRQLCCGGSDRLIEIWTLPTNDELVPAAHASRGTPREIQTFAGHAARVQDLALSPDGRTLASSGYDSAVGLWDIHPLGTEQPVISLGVLFVNQPVSLSPDLKQFIALTRDENLEIWDVAQSQLMQTRVIPHVRSRNVHFAPDAEHYAVRHEGPGDFWFCKVGDRYERTSADRLDSLCELVYSADSRVVATTHRDGSVRVWDPSTGQVLHALSFTEQKPAGVALSRDGHLLALADAQARIVNLQTEDSIPLPEEAVGGSLQFSPDDSLLLVRNGTDLHIMETATGMLRRAIRLPADTLPIVCSPDAKTLATGAYHTVTLWHIETGQKLASIPVPGDRRGVRMLQFSADGQHLAAAAWSYQPGHPDANTAALYIW